MERKPDWLPDFPVLIYCNRRHPMDLIHRPNKTITQFLSLSHTVGVHLKNFFCREDSRLTPQNNQPDEPEHQQMEPFPHAHTCQSYFRSGRTARPTCAGSDAAFLVASATFWESRFPAPQLFHSSAPVFERPRQSLEHLHQQPCNRMRPFIGALF